MLVRASEYGNSRTVLGVHYVLDVIGGRALAQYDLAQALAYPAYQNNANFTGTPIALQATFAPAATELNAYLATNCGGAVASCAAGQVNPYAPSAANAATYAQRLTYNLPTLTYAQAPREQAPTGGGDGNPDASILLATVYGGDSAAAKLIAPNGGIDGDLATSTINQIIVNTEGRALAAFYGTPMSYWTRINLYAAADYIKGVTETLTTANGDHIKTDATVAPGGAIDVTGLLTVDGKFALDAGGALGFMLGGLVPVTDFSQLAVGGAADLRGALDLSLDPGFVLGWGDSFDLVKATGGVLDGVSALYLDGAACSALGGDLFRCSGDGHSDLLSLAVIGGTDLTLKVDAVPEPATWALVLAGVAAFGLAGYRRTAERTPA
jgi:hypothetical protein